MAFTFHVWSIEKLNGNNLKDEDEIFLTPEIYAIISKKLLLLEIEFENFVLKGSTHEHHIFMKKDKLIFGTIFLNVVNSLLRHVAHLRNAKEVWNNLFTTFEKQHVGNCYNYVYTIFKWKKTLQCKMALTNFTWLLISKH